MNKKISITMEVPDWAICIVTEQSGHVYVWDSVPKPIDCYSDGGVWNGPGRCHRIFEYSKPCDNWKESLVMLPQWKEDEDPDAFI